MTNVKYDRHSRSPNDNPQSVSCAWSRVNEINVHTGKITSFSGCLNSNPCEDGRLSDTQTLKCEVTNDQNCIAEVFAIMPDDRRLEFIAVKTWLLKREIRR